MEKRQLDLNAPFLSVRRFSSPSNSTEFVKGNVTGKPRPLSRKSLPVTKSQHEFESTKPVAVPFHWEQFPGRPKDEVHTPEEPLDTPRLPPGRLSDAIRRSGEMPKLPPGKVASSSRFNSGERLNDNVYRPQVESFPFNDHANLLEKLNESLNCDKDSDSESDEDAYSDALEKLSLDYSVSGLSGCHSSGLESSRTFSVDKQTREFMMNRFLPAAKAVVIETPHHAVKKPLAVMEQPKLLKKVVSGEINPFLKQYDLVSLPYYSHYKDNVESEDGDEVLPPVRVKKSGKTWGILPKFCVKNSLCLLNPLPGLKSKTHTQCSTPSTGDIRRLTRNAHSGPLDKKSFPAPQKKKFHSGLLSRDLSDINNSLTNDPYEFLNSRESLKSGLSNLRRYRSGSISPYRNESPRSPFREGAGFLGVPKEVDNHNADKIASSRKLFKALQDVSRNQITERAPLDDPMEKTLYVDSIKKTSLPLPKLPIKKADTLKFLEGMRKAGEYRAVQSTQDTKAFEEEKKTSPGFLLNDITDRMGNFKPNRSSDQESLDCNEVPSDLKYVIKEELNEELGDRRDLLRSPLPPPLPKSPSESWLWRTLGTPFSHSRRRSPLHSKNERLKGSTTNTKWETIVKTSNPRHNHVRYSEELVPRISCRHNKS